MTVKKKLIDAALYQAVASKLEADANLSVYLENAAAVAEHPNVVQEVMNLVKQVAEADECIKIIEGYKSEVNEE